MFNEHTLTTLEFPRLLSLIAGRCLTPYGSEQVTKIKPGGVKADIDHSLDQISQMQDIIKFGEPLPLYRMEDCRDLLAQTTVEGALLDSKEIRRVLELIVASIQLHGYDKENRDNFPLIAELLSQLRAFPDVQKEINKAIDDDGTVKDSASKKLRNIRYDLGDSRIKITRSLEKIIAGRSKQAGWQDDVITQRNGRFVIPVPTNKYQSDMGILHDRSQSGATLFIEPSATVETNNRINILLQDEQMEINRILRALTAELALRGEPLMKNADLIGQIDRIHAAASFSNKIQAVRPVTSDEPMLSLIDARHPLLIVQFNSVEKVIPTTLGLGSDRQALLVTGPNTGGKTVTLKTVGLLQMMVQSGLPIPANHKSKVGIFDNIFADIGDEQSLELSLSTFSSHIRNIISGIRAANDRVLLLFDEIGVGTDPKEGAALAETTILYAVKRGAKMIVTTHYSQLKTLAMEHGEIENASLEFDHSTLAPTYHLQVGIPGSSFAVEIAGRLGIPEEICLEATKLIGSGERSLSELIASLEEELAQVRKDKTELTERLAKATELETYYKIQTDALKKDVDTAKKKALADTESFVDQTRKEVERLVAEIRRSQASKESLSEFHSTIKERADSVKKRQEPERPKEIDHGLFSVGDAVMLLSLDREGEIEELLGTERARVRVGNITTTVDLRSLRKIASSPQSKPVRSAGRYQIETDISPEIHLRGMTVEEALDKLERFLDQAVVSSLTQLYVIHGKGTGTLRRQLTAYLRKHKEVASVRMGDFNEGGAGVTVVKLKA